MDTVKDQDVDIHDKAERKDNAKNIRKLMEARLDTREITVLEMKYGLNGYDEGITLVEIGKVIGVTRERVRQIEIAAMQKLRTENNQQGLLEQSH